MSVDKPSEPDRWSDLYGARRRVIACATVIEEMRPHLSAEVPYEVLDFGLHLKPQDLKRVLQEKIIAGAFGTYLNLDSALDIGLLPCLPNAQYTQVGNAAGVGAKMALLSRKERARAQQVARRTGYVELTVYPGFQRRFAMLLLFPG